jgi:hypothetical protein
MKIGIFSDVHGHLTELQQPWHYSEIFRSIKLYVLEI